MDFLHWDTLGPLGDDADSDVITPTESSCSGTNSPCERCKALGKLCLKCRLKKALTKSDASRSTKSGLETVLSRQHPSSASDMPTQHIQPIKSDPDVLIYTESHVEEVRIDTYSRSTGRGQHVSCHYKSEWTETFSIIQTSKRKKRKRTEGEELALCILDILCASRPRSRKKVSYSREVWYCLTGEGHLIHPLRRTSHNGLGILYQNSLYGPRDKVLIIEILLAHLWECLSPLVSWGLKKGRSVMKSVFGGEQHYDELDELD
ncbi:hypothetical protein NM208_g5264 [Fusarium decemcellulare]|uniref:Uncharacterized protein n=1 Tax=Fusarium decemcellulare TaxID=57161 RepID=A0ACC1SHV6_9HYPO|nr:hypothetical protein NM208_g5264 [Fusarium decemcellulare]